MLYNNNNNIYIFTYYYIYIYTCIYILYIHDYWADQLFSICFHTANTAFILLLIPRSFSVCKNGTLATN